MKFKKFNKVMSVFLTICILCMTNIFAYASTKNTSTTDKYIYPITPESPEWSSFTSHEEMVDACQIPVEKIDKMDTSKLLDAFLDYPLLLDIYAYNSLEKGFNAIWEQCDALNYLLNRYDIGEILLDKYSVAKVITNKDDLDRISYNEFFSLGIMEILIAQPEVIEKTNDQIMSKLYESIIIKTSEKPDNIYGTSKFSYFNVLNEIKDEGLYEKTSYVSELSINLSASSSDYSTGYTVTTPKGSKVDVMKLNSGCDLSSSEKTKHDNYMASVYPNATRISGATKKFNCHSYAWYNQSTSNAYWMNDPSKYMSDKSYKNSGLVVGNKIYYGSIGDHSGVVSQVKVGMAGCYVTSKWGEYGIYKHFYNYCPYNSSNITLWTKS